MKKVLLILACGIAAQLSYAQATPKWAGKAKKAVFSIVTYDKDNKIKNTGNGFYINEMERHYPIIPCLKEPNVQ